MAQINVSDIRIVRNIRTKLGDVSVLMQSIRENGLIQAIIVCKMNQEYILVCGHRRFSALKKLGRKSLEIGKEVTITKEKLTIKDIIVLNIIENFQRKDNSPLEVAKAASDLREEGMTTSEIAVKLTCSKNKILIALKLLDTVPERVRETLGYGGSGRNNKKGILPANVASAIADNVSRYRVPKKNIETLYEIAREKDLSTKDVRLIGLGISDGLSFDESVNLTKEYKNKQVDFIVNENELKKLGIPFKKYIINVLNGKEKFNKDLFYKE